MKALRLTLPILTLALAIPSFGAPLEAEKDPDAPNLGKIAHLDSRNGFFSITFGDAVSDHEKLLKKSDKASYSDKVTFYEYQGLPDWVDIDSSLVIALEGKIAGVVLHLSDTEDSVAFRKIVELAYGKGVQPEEGSSEYKWGGKVANCSLKIGDDGKMEFQIFNNELLKQLEKIEFDFLNSLAKKI